MRLLVSGFLVLACATTAPAQMMRPPGFPGQGGAESPYGTGGYGLPGQGDPRSAGGMDYGGVDPRTQPDSFFGSFRSASRSRGSKLSLARRMALSKRGAGAGALGAFGLPGAGAVPAIPAELLAGANAGPLTIEQARELVAALVSADIESMKSTGATYSQRAAARRTYVPTSDPDVAALQAKVDELVPDPAGSTPDLPPRTLDHEAIQSWFEALDLSKDRGVTFLEWRDRTGLGLPLFRKLDAGADGLLQFDELARALVLNAAGSDRSVDPKMLEWATTPPAKEGEPEDPRKADDLLPPQSIDEMLARARAVLADAALQQSAQEPEAATSAAGAKGAAGKGATAKPKSKAGGDLFDLLRGGSKSKTPARTRPPLPMPVPQPATDK